MPQKLSGCGQNMLGMRKGGGGGGGVEARVITRAVLSATWLTLSRN